MRLFRPHWLIALIVALATVTPPAHAQTISQTSKITVQLEARLVKQLDLSTVEDALTRAFATSLTNGTGSGQANNVFHDQRTLSASGTEDLDLAGVLTSSNGQTLTFTKVKALIIKAAAANTNNVVVSRPASNGLVLFSAAADAVPVLPDGILVLTAPGAGITVTASTGDLLTITNSAGSTSVTYDVVIIGTT